MDEHHLARYASGQYNQPGPDDVRALLREQGWTGSDVARITGVDGRTVRRWTGGHTPIPYAAWRLLLIEAGLVR